MQIIQWYFLALFECLYFLVLFRSKQGPHVSLLVIRRPAERKNECAGEKERTYMLQNGRMVEWSNGQTKPTGNKI